jgi:organic hydroperoxide reductase OsmC/OhrA
MSYQVKISWERIHGEAFVDNHYSRSHTWSFDGGIELAASSSPHVVPLPYSNEAAVDPEEAIVAAISSCHMLWFLSMAVENNYLVERYDDHAEGVLGKDEHGRLAMVRVTLKPKAVFGSERIPTRQQIDEFHQLAHEKCFIANSVKTKITILPNQD